VASLLITLEQRVVIKSSLQAMFYNTLKTFLSGAGFYSVLFFSTGITWMLVLLIQNPIKKCYNVIVRKFLPSGLNFPWQKRMGLIIRGMGLIVSATLMSGLVFYGTGMSEDFFLCLFFLLFFIAFHVVVILLALKLIPWFIRIDQQIGGRIIITMIGSACLFELLIIFERGHGDPLMILGIFFLLSHTVWITCCFELLRFIFIRLFSRVLE
jgi:hypothetical protein